LRGALRKMSTSKKGLKDLSLAQLAKLNNAIAAKYEGVKKVSRFRSKDDGMATVRTVLAETGERVIFVLQPEYVKRGKAAPRFTKYYDGMIASDYVDVNVAEGHPRGDCVRDLRYDANLGLIALV